MENYAGYLNIGNKSNTQGEGLKRFLIFLMIISLSKAAIAGEKLVNGTMESMGSWTPTPLYSTGMRSFAQAYQGLSSFVVSIIDDNNDNAPDGAEGEIRSNQFSTSHGTQYTMSGWFKVTSFQSINRDAEILIILYRGDGTGLPSAIKRIVEKDVVIGQWIKLQIGPFKDNHHGNRAQIGLLANVGKVEDWVSIPVIYWDDISLSD